MRMSTRPRRSRAMRSYTLRRDAGAARRMPRRAPARHRVDRWVLRCALAHTWLPVSRTLRAPPRPGGRLAPRLRGAAAKHEARAAEARSAATDPGAPAEGLPQRAR